MCPLHISSFMGFFPPRSLWIFQNILFKNIYLFGCTGSWWWHLRSSLHHAGYFIAAHGLSSCGMQDQLPHSMWDLSSWTKDRTRTPCMAKQVLNHWTAREVPIPFFSLCLGLLPSLSLASFQNVNYVTQHTRICQVPAGQESIFAS